MFYFLLAKSDLVQSRIYMQSANYFDLDRILCEEEVSGYFCKGVKVTLDCQGIPVEFEHGFNQSVSELFESKSPDEVRTLPLWMTRDLASKGYVQADMPKDFKPRMLSKIKAGATTVKFSRNPYYYDLGIELALVKRLDWVFR
eukprot:753511-Hanusia_phi.AAC.5